MILSKRKGKWRTSGTGGWVKVIPSPFCFVEVVSCCFGQPPATIMPASRISDTPGSQFTTNNSMLEIQCARLLYHYCEDLAIQLGMVVQCN